MAHERSSLEFLRLLRRYRTTKGPAARPFCLETRSSKTFIIASCTLAIFTDCFLYGIVVPVLPFALTERVGIASEDVGLWIAALLACYAGTWLVFAPLAGYITDYFTSRRTTFVLALTTLTGATVLIYIGSSIGMLVVGRALQGVSSALTWTAGVTLTIETVQEHEVGQTLGICSLGMNLALLLAPVLGGLLLEQSGYHSVFAITFALLALDVTWRLTLIERSAVNPGQGPPQHVYWTTVFGENGTPRIMPSPTREDIPNLEPLLVSAERPPLESDIDFEDFIVSYRLGENSVQTISPVRRDVRESGRRGKIFTQTIIPLMRLLRRPRLVVALWATFAQTTITTSLDAVLPLFVKDKFTWGPQAAGLIFMPIVLPTFWAPFVGAVTDRDGPKWMTSMAFILGCPIWILLRLVTHAGVSQSAILCILLAMVGVTATLATAPLMAEITFAVKSQNGIARGRFGPRGPIAQAYALYSFSLAGGLLVGPLWGGLIMELGGWKTMTWTLSLLSGVTVGPTIFFTGGRLRMADIRWPRARA
ncbi:hypothetical protein AYL99_11896 [Fonsecaea erecta]|uniref:Major facilitator superfamily (MFS) profile domain-containing protein n=1 Tax=Fonsecaea erecta TaxID=1367422 RepID=A0A178Z2E3_9EURO|nr:hypothetical protein AYL99_11896 [Fonsecaea erecta]OAP53874.1 hypothetical protein AYL99_11896 [Fonsecaea erecta]